MADPTPTPIRSGEQQQQLLQLQRVASHASKLLCLQEDPLCVDVVVNPDGLVWRNRIGHGWEQAGAMRESEIRRLLSGIATVRGVELNHEHPIVETDIPGNGSRIEGLLSPVVNGAALAIRPLNRQVWTLGDYIAGGISTEKTDPQNSKRHQDHFLGEVRGKCHAEILRLALRYRRNIVVAGGTGSGKTTFSNMVLQEASRLTPRDRVVVIEDTRELRCPLENHVSLLAAGNISLLQCLKVTLRLAPDRIVVGEVRDENARELLNAWNTGHPGGIATVHANDALNVLRRFEQLLNSSTAETKETIAQAVNIVFFMDKDPSIRAGRKLREVMLVHAYDRVKQEYVTEYI